MYIYMDMDIDIYIYIYIYMDIICILIILMKSSFLLPNRAIYTTKVRKGTQRF